MYSDLGFMGGIGKIKELDKFDAKFFNTNEVEANCMNSQIRMCLEVVFEAIWDSGNYIKI